MEYCSKCNLVYGNDEKFCTQCGEELTHTDGELLQCYNCQTLVDSHARFCHKCGAEFASGEENDDGNSSAYDGEEPEEDGRWNSVWWLILKIVIALIVVYIANEFFGIKLKFR